MSFTIIDISSEKLKDCNLNSGLERWMEATNFKLKEILPKTYERLIEYREKGESLEVYEKEIREVFLNIAGECIGEFFALRGYTGYEGRKIPCICGKEEMEFHGYREKEYISLASKITIKRAYYWSKGCRRGQFPLDEILDVVGTHFSPGVRKISNCLGGELPFKEVEGIMRGDMNIQISEKEIERDTEETGKRFEEMVKEEVKSCMEGKIPNVEDEEKGEVMYIQVDGTTVNTDSGLERGKEWSSFLG